MNLKICYVLALFSVFLIVGLTPAFAIQMGEVANNAKNYEIDSHKKKGFFAKITFLAKGFKLVNTAQNAQKGSDSQEGNIKADDYDSILNNTLNSFCQAHNLLNFKNSKTKSINTIKTQNTEINNGINQFNDSKNTDNIKSNTKNSTRDKNSTGSIKNNEKVSSTVNYIIPNFEIPNYCQIDAEMMVDRLTKRGINISISINSKISDALDGKIVQMIDDKGYLRYVMVKNITDSQVNIVTDNNNTKSVSLKEFKAAYTGIVLESPSGIEILGIILEIQKESLQNQKSVTNKLKDDAKCQLILWGILAGVAILLIIIGSLIGIFFAKTIANEVTSQSAINVETTSQQACQELTLESTSAGGNRAIFGNFEGTLYKVTANEIFLAASPGEDFVSAAAAGLGMGASIAGLATLGLIIVPIIGIELVSNVMLQNWIKVILGTVGMILVVVGLVLAITSIIHLGESFGKLIIMSDCYNEIMNENNALSDWIKVRETDNNPDNSSKTLRINNISSNNTNKRLNLNRRIIPSSF